MAENLEKKGCPQKDSVEHEEYAGASRSFRRIWKERNRVQPELLEKIRIYARLAELLRDSEHEEPHRQIESMAVSSRKDVYLEALEEAEDEDSEPMQARSTL